MEFVNQMNNITLTVTGLRSHKTYGGNYNDPRYIELVNFSTELLALSPWIKTVNIGMATGSDLLFGLAALRHKGRSNDLTVKCFIPGINQTRYYNDKEKEIYNFILGKADKVKHITNEECTPKNLKKRNRKMVDKCEWVLAFWDYNKHKSGTWSTINDAIKKDKTVYVVNPFNLAQKGFLHVSQEDLHANRHNITEALYMPLLKYSPKYTENREVELYRGYTDEL